MLELQSNSTRNFFVINMRPQSAKEPIREIPDEPHEPEILPDLPPEPEPDLSPEIPDTPVPEIIPGGNEPEISPSPDF
jgi:hypothetical protein